MKRTILYALFLLSTTYVRSQIYELYDNSFQINDSLNGHYSSIFEYRWDTLYLRTSRTPSATIKDTLICLRTPEYTKFQMPVKGKVISEFGWRGRRIHTGIDIKLNKGDTVYCSFDGIVRISRYLSGYGNIVVVRHFNGIETVYSHLDKRLVNVNDTLKAGQILGLGGRTGRATTEHLHFETRYKEQPFNPRLIIDFENHSLKKDTLFITQQSFSFKKNIDNNYTANNSSNSNTNDKVHVVQKGDTLYSIARRYNTTVNDLCKTNGISENRILSIGQTIKIP